MALQSLRPSDIANARTSVHSGAEARELALAAHHGGANHLEQAVAMKLVQAFANPVDDSLTNRVCDPAAHGLGEQIRIEAPEDLLLDQRPLHHRAEILAHDVFQALAQRRRDPLLDGLAEAIANRGLQLFA